VLVKLRPDYRWNMERRQAIHFLARYTSVPSVSVLCLAVLTSACGVSDREREIIESCKQSGQSLDVYDSDGEHLPDTRLGRNLIDDVCRVKAELYVEGYRIDPTINRRDMWFYQQHVMQDKNLRSLYLNSIR